MITKILFTAAVIGVVFFLLGRRSHTRPQKALTTRASSHEQSALISSRFTRIAAYAVVATMVVASALFAYREWEDAYRIVNIRVINARTGDMVTYQAHKRDVDGRRFLTLDGRLVTLAEVERMELIGRQ
jgi:anti-sigma-K factor RskA